MNRREAFLASFAVVVGGAPLAGNAQSTRKVYRVGILTVGTTASATGPRPQAPSTSALLRGMRELGYVYGEHFVTEARGAGDHAERFPALAAEVVRLAPDVVVAAGPSLDALKQATSTLPVVMASSGDPVSSGLVHSLAHPGRNFTGMSSQTVDSTGKRLELLKELVPGAAPVAVLWDQSQPHIWKAAQMAAEQRGWKLLSLEIRDAGGIDAAFKAATDARASALFVQAPAVLQLHAGQFAALALKHRLPTIFHQDHYVRAGGLMAFGANSTEIWHRAAVFVDKILKGAKPGDLPVEQPTRFELLLNLKTAKVLGLTIPHSLLVRADEVIR